MGFRFSNYDVNELRSCGQEFERKFSADASLGNCGWTADVFQWFRDAAADGVRVYPTGNEGKKGEFIVDLCHTTYPLDEVTDGEWPSTIWYERASEVDCGMKLALESEWGKWASRDRSHVMVLDDACKLAVLRAEVKVMIFARHLKDDLDRAPKALRELRLRHRDSDPWLWIDVPNQSKRASCPRRPIRHGILHD